MTSRAAQELGKKGGSVKSEAKTKAAKANAAKPRGKWVTAVAYRGDTKDGDIRFGVILGRGKLSGDEQFEAICKTEKEWEWGDLETVTDYKRLI